MNAHELYHSEGGADDASHERSICVSVAVVSGMFASGLLTFRCAEQVSEAASFHHIAYNMTTKHFYSLSSPTIAPTSHSQLGISILKCENYGRLRWLALAPPAKEVNNSECMSMYRDQRIQQE